jgi:hypothetical protein
MGMSRRSRRFTAWIACMAMLAALFMPGLSYALSAQSPAHGASHAADHEFCSTEAAPESAPAPVHSAFHGAHCPFCLLHMDVAAPPPALSGFLPLRTGLRYRAPAFLHARRSLHVWLSAQPRAPPAFA